MPSGRAQAKKPKALAISWFFVPYVGSADVDFFKRIKDLNVEFDVLQAKRGFRDDKLLDFDYHHNIHRTEIVIDHQNPRSEASRSGFLKECLEHFDSNHDKYDFLISHSNEVHSHRVAYEIKRKSGLPWIAYFGDPSAKNPYIKYYGGYPFYDEDNETERLAIQHADRLVFNNEYQRKTMLEGFERYHDKSLVVTHFFNPDMYPEPPARKPSGKFRFGYFGTLYTVKRKGDIVFKAVDRLLQIYPEYGNRFIIEFYGFMTYQDLQDYLGMRSREMIAIGGTVPYIESLGRMREMDALLLIDAFFNQEQDGLDFNPFFPCKLTDYLGAKKPILGITMERGTPGEILKESGNLIADERVDRVAFLLKRYIDGKVKVDYSVYQRYTGAPQVRKLQALIDDLLSMGKRR